jgi:hypothetical protein
VEDVTPADLARRISDYQGIVVNGVTMENLGLQVAQLASRIKADKNKGLLFPSAVLAGLWVLSR